MSPYRTDAMTPEEERNSLRDLLQTKEQEATQLRRLLASAEARLATSRDPKAILLSGVSKALPPMPQDMDAILADWHSFWKDNFNLDLDFTTLRIPEREGFNRLIIMVKGMTPERLYAKCKELFPCWKYTDNLDTVTSDRDPANPPAGGGAYAIWVRDRVEADEELKNKSANMLEKAGINGETLPECLLHELKYFTETGEHLDVNNVTLCSGSRHPGGDVPYVYWFSGYGRMGVFWCSPDYRYGYLRARAAVYT